MHFLKFQKLCRLEHCPVEVVINRYGNFHLTNTDTETDILILTDADTDTNTDKKKTNSPIPIPIRRKGIHRYRCPYRYEKLFDTDTNTIIFD